MYILVGKAETGLCFLYANLTRPLIIELGQWAGEKISTRDKSVVADEFKELEQDIELRKQGILRCAFVLLPFPLHHVDDGQAAGSL